MRRFEEHVDLKGFCEIGTDRAENRGFYGFRPAVFDLDSWAAADPSVR